MTGLTLLVLLVAQSPDADAAVVRAAHEALGPGAAVVVRRVNEPASDEEAIALEEGVGADAVAQVIFARPRVTLHVHLAHDLRWVDRELRFSRADAPPDEWRTVGFALASMVPDAEPEDDPAPPAPPAAPARSTAIDDPVADRPPAAAAPPPPRRFAFDLAAIGGGPIHSDEGTVGGTLAGTWFFADRFGVRAAAALRTAEVEQGRTEARSLFVDAALGLAWRSDPRPVPGTFSFGARLDLLLTEQIIARLSRFEPERQFHRLVPGADLVMEALWSFTPHAAVVLGVGAQTAWRTSAIRVDGTDVTTVALLSPLFEAGLRAGF